MSNLLKTKFTLNLKLCSPLFEIVSLPEEESVGEPSEASSKAKESQHTCSSILLTPRKHLSPAATSAAAAAAATSTAAATTTLLLYWLYRT